MKKFLSYFGYFVKDFAILALRYACHTSFLESCSSSLCCCCSKRASVREAARYWWLLDWLWVCTWSGFGGIRRPLSAIDFCELAKVWLIASSSSSALSWAIYGVFTSEYLSEGGTGALVSRAICGVTSRFFAVAAAALSLVGVSRIAEPVFSTPPTPTPLALDPFRAADCLN